MGHLLGYFCLIKLVCSWCDFFLVSSACIDRISRLLVGFSRAWGTCVQMNLRYQFGWNCFWFGVHNYIFWQ